MSQGPYNNPYAGGGGGWADQARMAVYPPGMPTVGSSTIYSGASGATGGSTQVTASLYVSPMPLLSPVAFNAINIAHTNSSAAGTGSVSQGRMLGIYTMNGGTALSLVSSFQNVLLASQNSSTAQSYYIYWGTNSTSNSTSSAGNAILTNCVGWRDFILYGSANSIPAGQYWVAEGITQRSSNANVFGISGHAVLAESSTNQQLGFQFGGTASAPPYPYMGIVSTTLNASTTGVPMMPASIPTASISGVNTSQWQSPYVVFKSL